MGIILRLVCITGGALAALAFYPMIYGKRVHSVVGYSGGGGGGKEVAGSLFYCRSQRMFASYPETYLW